jgi:arylsulfatase A-like enzyme
LFSGQLPSDHGTHRKSPSFKKPADESLAGTLSDAGYHTGGFSANPWLSPALQFDTGFDHFEYITEEPPFSDEPIVPNTTIGDLYSIEGIRSVLQWCFEGNPLKRFSNGVWKRYLDSGAGVKQVNEVILEWIDNCDEDNKFIFANYMDVHDPHYDYPFGRSDLCLPSASTRLDMSKSRCQAAYSKRIDFMSEPSAPERSRRLYDQAIRHVDEGLRDLFEELEDKVNLDESLVVILGDHGESLGENGYWGHGTYLHQQLIRIPLLICPPKEHQPLDSDQPTTILDITDYIMEKIGASLNKEHETIRSVSSGDKPLFAETIAPRANMEQESLKGGFEAVIYDGQKLVRNRKTGETTLTEIDNKGQTETEQRQLEALLKNKWGDIDYEIENEEVISDEMRSRLSDLGYL